MKHILLVVMIAFFGFSACGKKDDKSGGGSGQGPNKDNPNKPGDPNQQVFNTEVKDPIQVNFYCEQKGPANPLKLNLHFKGNGEIAVTENPSNIPSKGKYTIKSQKEIEIELELYTKVTSVETEMVGGILVRMESDGFICHAVAHEHAPPQFFGRYSCEILANEAVLFDFGLVGGAAQPTPGAVFRSHQFNLTDRYERAHGIMYAYENGALGLIFADVKEKRRSLTVVRDGDMIRVSGYEPELTNPCKRVE